MFKHIKKYLQIFTPPVFALIAILFATAIVYAAVSTSATGGGAVTQFTTNWGDCRNIQNNNGQTFFVPANSQGEWDAFLSNAPNKVLSSCCTTNSGQACTSGANACGQTNTGTYSCSGVCSASTPANPANYGNACTSSANACGQTNNGTIQCDGSCSAGVPTNPVGYGNACTSPANACGQTNNGTIQCDGSCSAGVPTNPVGYGNACTSSANICGQTNSGTIQCNGSCSATQPADSSCPATYQLQNTTTINGATGCHYEYECSNQTGFATSPQGSSCSTIGDIVTCYFNDSASGCSGGKVQGFFRDKETYMCSY